jgi:hypothetical protein
VRTEAPVRPVDLQADRPPQPGGDRLWRSLRWWLLGAAVARLAIAPFTSHPYDMSVWISTQVRLFNTGINPLFDWKYSTPMLGLLLTMYWPAVATHAVLHVPLTLALQFWIKVPFIAADLATAWALALIVLRISGNGRLARWTAVLWLFNPAGLFFSAVHGQFDPLPAFFIALALWGFASERRGLGYGSLLLGGIAKFAGFPLIPVALVWDWRRGQLNRRRVLGLGITSVAVVGLAFVSLFFPSQRAGLLGGVSSSVLRSPSASRWSIWAGSSHPPHEGWLLLFLLGLLVILAVTARRASCGPEGVLVLSAGFAATLALLASLDPYGNPQFVLWSLPLLILIGMLRRSPILLLLSAGVAVVDLFTFWTSEGPGIWLLNAVPAADRGLSVGVPPIVNKDLSVKLGVAYALLLMMAGLYCLFAQANLPGSHRSEAFAWRAVRIGCVVPGGLLALLLVGTVFRSSLLSRYGHAPVYPQEVMALNLFSPTSTSWNPQGYLLQANWPPIVRRIPTVDRSKLSLELRSGRPLSPVIDAQFATSAERVTGRGISQHFTLRPPAAIVGLRVLLGHPGPLTGTALPHLRLEDRWGLVFDERLRLLRPTSPGWYLMDAVPTSVLPKGGAFVAVVSAPDSADWVWNGAGHGRGRRAWLQVFAVPGLSEYLARHVDVRASILSDGTLRLGFPQEPKTIDHFKLRLPFWRGLGPPIPALRLDVNSAPWWRRFPLTAALVSFAAVAFPGLIVLVLWIGVHLTWPLRPNQSKSA